MKRRRRTYLADAPVAPPQSRRAGLRKFLAVDEWRRLLATARKTGLRETALILVMYETGLRREEPGKLRLSYMQQLHKRQLYVWRGKNSKSGWCNLSAVTVRSLYNWICEAYPEKRTRKGSAFVFPGHVCYGSAKGLSGRAVYNIFYSLAQRAGLPAAVRHPHVLKATRAQHLLEAADADPSITPDRLYQSIAGIVGHRAARTTIEHYTQSTGAERRLVESVTEELVK